MFNKFHVVPKNYVIVSRSTDYPVDLNSIKEQLKLDEDDTSEDSYLTSLLLAAISVGELITKRDFYVKTYKTFLDCFPQSCGFELRKSPLNSIVFIRYYKNNVLETLDSSLYYFTESNTFSSVLPVNNWPSNIDSRAQSVQIQFLAGYSPDNFPADLKVALLQHITSLYENRGDCSSTKSCMSFLPCNSKAIYDMNRIMDLRV